MGGFLGTVSAADLVVNNANTTSSDINSWMKNSTTVKGDSLVFNVGKYDLNDTINVSKSINIKSNVKTLINFNKNKAMFNITGTGCEINFSGLTLQHNGKGTIDYGPSIILSKVSSTTVNIKDMNLILNGNYLCAVALLNGKGNISNCYITGKGSYNEGVYHENWVGNIYKSSFVMEKSSSFCVGAIGTFTGNISYSKFVLKGSQSFGLIMYKKWMGNFVNSNITSSGNDFHGIFAEKWTGKISGSKIYNSGYRTIGVYSNSSTKGIIYKSTISAKQGYAVMVSKNVKVSSSTLVSAKNIPKVYVFGPRVDIYDITSYTKSKNYYFRIKNFGESTSKTSYLIITANGYKKVVKVKPIKKGKYLKIKVILPKKYSTSKYTKYAKVYYVDGYGKKVYSISSKFKW